MEVYESASTQDTWTEHSKRQHLKIPIIEELTYHFADANEVNIVYWFIHLDRDSQLFTKF